MLAILRAKNAVGMIWETGKNCDFMSGAHPVAGKLRNPRSRRAHLRREILRYVENLQPYPQ